MSVIVPALAEDVELSRVRAHWGRLEGDWEVLVAEGAGRARPLNAVAATARGELLLFLHADSRLPADAYTSLACAAADPEVVGGNFALRFEGGDVFARVLTAVYALKRRFGWYYGDSSVWVRRSVFEALGGYRELPIMDDCDFVSRLEAAGRTVCLPGPAHTSDRRWRAVGVPRTLLSWWAVRWLYVAGVSPARLARLYRRIR
ncbi:MAG: TIGR04283 family arsenosugar biosynthesis glycosyltransferase [Solirubrobacteraceae bacterium]